MDGWHRVSRQNPCPICGKPDNCVVSDDGTFAYCGRVDEGSSKQNAGGQFLHRLKESQKPSSRPPATVAKPRKQTSVNRTNDWEILARAWFNMPWSKARRKELAELLGVSAGALRLLCVGFNDSAWTIPQRDGMAKIIGIQRRDRGGCKTFVCGSNAGLIFGRGWKDGDGPILLPEGASDVAALMTLGLNAVGRPSNTAGADFLVELLRSIPKDRPVVMLAEHDRKPSGNLKPTHRADCEGCSQCWPGRYGAIETAKKLSAALDRPIQWAFPPDGAKDVREWLQQASESDRQRMLNDSKGSIADALGSAEILSALRRDFLDRLNFESINIALPPVEQPVGPQVGLDDWREQLRARRIESVGQPGVNLDRSGTGYGKTTADFAAIELVAEKDGRALVILPTHKNCTELEKELQDAGIDAVAYPGRLTEGDDQNCWNSDADIAEKFGLSAVAAVCPACPERKRCSEWGYLKELKQASDATVAIATHNRAKYAGLASLSVGREFVAIHEDSLDVLRPACSVTESELRIARDAVLTRLVNDTKWLNWYGDVPRLDDDGKPIRNDKLRQRREALREFAILLNELSDWLLMQFESDGRTRRLVTPRTIPKAIGIERLIFRATHEARKVGHKLSSSVWRLLLAVATGEIADLGVIVDGSADKFTARKTDHGNLDEQAKSKCDSVAV